jgi:ligand-binding SRPBCC domain-containing protein
MRRFVFEQDTLLPLALEETFSFFANAENLEAITPPWLHFSILTPTPITMQAGTLIDYRLRVHGIPLRWQTEITRWNPPYDFTDEQKRGPYRLWIHRHVFTAEGDQTRMRDQITYAVFGGSLINRLFVQKDVLRIFNHRQTAIQALLPNHHSRSNLSSHAVTA